MSTFLLSYLPTFSSENIRLRHFIRIGYYKRYLSTSSHILCRKSIIVDKKVSDFLFDC